MIDSVRGRGGAGESSGKREAWLAGRRLPTTRESSSPAQAPAAHRMLQLRGRPQEVWQRSPQSYLCCRGGRQGREEERLRGEAGCWAGGLRQAPAEAAAGRQLRRRWATGRCRRKPGSNSSPRSPRAPGRAAWHARGSCGWPAPSARCRARWCRWGRTAPLWQGVSGSCWLHQGRAAGGRWVVSRQRWRRQTWQRCVPGRQRHRQRSHRPPRHRGLTCVQAGHRSDDRGAGPGRLAAHLRRCTVGRRESRQGGAAAVGGGTGLAGRPHC